MATAFQRNAFQNNAFQIDDRVVGGPRNRTFTLRRPSSHSKRKVIWLSLLFWLLF